MHAFMLLFFVAVVGGGQDAPAPECPKVVASCPASVESGTPLVCAAVAAGGDETVTPTYNWTVSAGTIAEGQGTATITIDTAGLALDSTITATVDIGGFAPECTATASASSLVLPKPEPKKIVEYGAISAKGEQAKLDEFFLELYNSSETKAYIYAYGGRTSKAGDARKAAERARAYLVGKREVDAATVEVVDAGYRDALTVELWIVPNIVDPPKPTPTFEPRRPKKPTGKKS